MARDEHRSGAGAPSLSRAETAFGRRHSLLHGRSPRRPASDVRRPTSTSQMSKRSWSPGHERQVTGHLEHLAEVRDRASGAGERL